MDASPLIAVAVITNGASVDFRRTSQQWIIEGFIPGRTLFFCGPQAQLVKQGVARSSIIEYVDSPYYRNNFHINSKKKLACDAIDAKFIFLVHDRFLPLPGLRATLIQVLSEDDIDFGAVDVDNPDGSPALRELRLRGAAAATDVESALEPVGRFACETSDPCASSHVAINGGQFFLRKSMTHHLSRPLRWMEMEDDVLSHDLRAARGRWIKEGKLITLTPRVVPDFNYTLGTKFKYATYRLICNFLSTLTGSLSVGRRLDRKRLQRCMERQCVLIDPLHKIASSDFLPSSLEKLMARARIASDGKSWANVEKHRFGWRLTGHQRPD